MKTNGGSGDIPLSFENEYENDFSSFYGYLPDCCIRVADIYLDLNVMFSIHCKDSVDKIL